MMAFSAITATYNKTLWYLNWLRGLGIKTPAIIGGPHVTFEPSKALDDGFDFIVRHEGELMFLPFLEALENKGDFSEIPNLCWKKDREKTYNPVSSVLPDLDKDSPFPGFSGYESFSPVEKKAHDGHRNFPQLPLPLYLLLGSSHVRKIPTERELRGSSR